MPLQKQMARVLFLAGLLGCGNGIAEAKSVPRFGIFVYSNFCISPMSSDLYGARVTLRRLADGDMLIYEYTDGSTHALVAEKFMLDEKSRTLRFELHDPAGSNASVSGKFSNDGSALLLRGMLFEGADRITALKRVMDFASPAGECVAKRN
jgi:hypothetical protein